MLCRQYYSSQVFILVICSYDSAARRLGRVLRRGGGGSSGVLHRSASHATVGWDGYASEASGYSVADSYRPGLSGAPSAAASDFDYAFEQGYHYAGSADAWGAGRSRRRSVAGSGAGRHWAPPAAAGWESRRGHGGHSQAPPPQQRGDSYCVNGAATPELRQQRAGGGGGAAAGASVAVATAAVLAGEATVESRRRGSRHVSAAASPVRHRGSGATWL